MISKETLSIDQFDGASDDINTPKKMRSKFAPLNIIHIRTPKRDGSDKIGEMLKAKREDHELPNPKRPKLS